MRPFLPILGLALILGIALSNAQDSAEPPKPSETEPRNFASSGDKARYWPGHCRISWKVCRRIKDYHRKYCKWGGGQKVCPTLTWLKDTYCWGHGHRSAGPDGGDGGIVGFSEEGDGEFIGTDEGFDPGEGGEIPTDGTDGGNLGKRQEVERHGGHGHGKCKFSWWHCSWIRWLRWYYCYHDYHPGLCWLFTLLYNLYCRWWF